MPGLPAIDFATVYPHFVWVSTEGADRAPPGPFRYRLLSVRHEPTQTVEFVILRENRLGARSQIIHARGPVENFEATTHGVLDRLGQSVGVTFRLFDLRDALDFEGFRAKAGALGWDERHPAG